MFWWMRTTIRLDDYLLEEARTVAAASGRTLTELIEDALREALARRRRGAGRARLALRTFNGNGPRPGVELDHSAALLDLMDRADAAP
jgi:hypothetical protein